MNEDSHKVIVTNVKMPFGSMVVFMVKWSLASIPALIIVGTIVTAIIAVSMTFIAGLNTHINR